MDFELTHSCLGWVGRIGVPNRQSNKTRDNAMKSSQTAISKESIIKLLDDIVKEFLTETAQIEFDKYNPQHLYIMCLYGRIIELGVSA